MRSETRFTIASNRPASSPNLRKDRHAIELGHLDIEQDQTGRQHTVCINAASPLVAAT
jgi:hypothetical protein